MLNAESLFALCSTYRQLKNQESHYNGGEWNSAIDAPDSEMFKTLDQLKDGFNGQNASQMMESMGEPDEITSDLENPYQSPSFMPGPFLGASSETQGILRNCSLIEILDIVYACYYWRNRHDFIYYQITNDVITSSGWYNALE